MDYPSRIRADLLAHADEKTKSTGTRFFREKVSLLGVSTHTVGKIGSGYFREIGKLPKSDVLRICETLYRSGFMEESFVASGFVYGMRETFEEADFPRFERWVGTYMDNWAVVDTFCNHSLGSFMEKYPSQIKQLKAWAKSDNRWKRRAAAVTLVLPARKGLFLKDVFDIADLLLMDKDDLVQKGYGWMLKEASKPHPDEVYEYILAHRQKMPRTALRYAIEKMPQDRRNKAMER